MNDSEIDSCQWVRDQGRHFSPARLGSCCEMDRHLKSIEDLSDGVDVGQRMLIPRAQDRYALRGKDRRDHSQLSAMTGHHRHLTPRDAIGHVSMAKTSSDLSHQASGAASSNGGYRSRVCGRGVVCPPSQTAGRRYRWHSCTQRLNDVGNMRMITVIDRQVVNRHVRELIDQIVKAFRGCSSKTVDGLVRIGGQHTRNMALRNLGNEANLRRIALGQIVAHQQLDP